MNILGIVAEFNPFHSGHAYLIEKAREGGATHIVCVMSGNFVQRGDVAICSKTARAEMALRSGADLVVELPVNFATATAQQFAFGAIATLDCLGCVNGLAFGSECGNIDELCDMARALKDGRFISRLKEILPTGVTFAAAREQALCDLGYNGALLRNPNDTLAVNYIEAINLLESDITPIAIKRVGAAHDGGAVDNFASASHIRSLICNNEDFSQFVPKASLDILKREIEAGRAPMDLNRLESAILSKLRTISMQEVLELPDIGEGLENRIFKAVWENTSVSEIIDSVKSKRYTHARIRRIILSAFLGINNDIYETVPQYIRILGINERGKEILSAARPCLPILARAKDIDSVPPEGKLLLIAEQRADNLSAMAAPTVQPCESTLSQIVIL